MGKFPRFHYHSNWLECERWSDIRCLYCKSGSVGNPSGSAVGSALELAWASLGSETSGSILLPAEKFNVVGIKPTAGLSSRYLTIPISPMQDTIGPIARTVSDAAALLQVIAV